MEYVDCKDALRQHVNKDDIVYLKNIVEDYKLLYKNVQGTTKFLNEMLDIHLFNVSVDLRKIKQKLLTIVEKTAHMRLFSITSYFEILINSKEKQV